jgi:hypothetical protein
MRQIFAINRAHYRILRNRLVERLGYSVPLYRMMIGGVLGCVLAFQAIVFMLGRWISDAVRENPTIAGYYVELVVMAHLCVASLVATCFFVIMANTAEAFGFLLRTLPVSRRVINVSADAPVLFVSVAIALSSTPAFAYVVATAVGPLAALASTGALIALAIGSSMACVAVVRAAVGVVSRVRAVRREAGEALGMLLPVAGAMALFYYAVVYPHDNPVRRLSSSYAAGLVDAALPASVVTVALLILAALAWIATTLLPRRPTDLLNPSLLGQLLTKAGSGTIRPRSGRSRVRLEIIQLLRNPNVGIALGLGTLALLAMIPLGLLGLAAADVILIGVVVDLTILVSVSSYGGTWRHHWLFRTMEERAGSWVRFKWLGTVLLVAAMVLVATAVMSGSVAPGLNLATYAVVMLAIGMCVGALLPVEDKLVLLVNVLLAGIATAIVVFGLGQLAPGLPGLGIAVLLLVGAYIAFRKVVVPREIRQPVP